MYTYILKLIPNPSNGILKIGFWMGIYILFSSTVKAQINETFTDGNFTANPTWVGDTPLYIVNGIQQLQSNGTVATSNEVSSITTPCNLTGNIEWQVYIKFNLSPSTQNYCRFYLSSDQTDLKGNLNGYYIQLGGSTGNTDSISLYKQSGASRTRLIAGRPGTVAKNINALILRVSKSAQGQWILQSDTTAGNTFITEGTAIDNQYPNIVHCGFSCRYTASNIKGFVFDNLTVTQGVDTNPPTLDSIHVVSANKLELIFSEDLDKTSAETITNYTVNNGINKPSQATLDAVNKNRVVLDFTSNFQNGTIYTLNISGVKDVIKNTMKTDAKIFKYGIAALLPIIINEIMADPSPKVGLPDAEFVELYNPNNTDIDLSNWIITDGTTSGTFSNTFGNPIIPADSFIILCPSSAVGLFSAFGNTAVLTGFPSLNNAGDIITIKDRQGNIRAQTQYDVAWYGGGFKAAGGWSLELLNPYSKCGGTANWKASIDANGGTPGKKNSVWNIFTDTVAPTIRSFNYLDSQNIQIIFSEPTDTNGLNLTNITISNGINISSAKFNSGGDTLSISIASQTFTDKQLYTVQLIGIKDCENNSRQLTYTFTYYKILDADFGDLVIDEIYAAPLANTPLPNNEWVELYNRTSHAIRTANYTFSDETGNYILPDAVILPNSYVILCAAVNQSKMNNYGKVIPMSSFPSLNNDGDQLSLKDNQGRLIHRVNYISSWYESNYKKNGAWSLEMIDPANICQGIGNWKASVDPTGGTPGKTNSINKPNPDQTKPNLIRAYTINNQTLQLYFSEPIDTLEMVNIKHYILSPVPLKPIHAGTLAGDASIIQLIYNDTFAKNTVYEISVDSLSDCWGNLLDKNTATFGIPETAVTGDIAINEVLFNSKTGGNDFVEIYNLSDKIIDLSTLKIANTDEAGQLKDIKDIPQYLLLPKTYVALCEDQSLVKNSYFTSNPNQFVDISSFPSYSDDEGTVVIITNQNKELERFTYSSKMHHPTLDNDDGISLERVDYTRSVSEATNWQTAATAIGGATPAYVNSQYNGNNQANGKFSLSPEVFSPDDDGYNDVLNLNYKMPEAGYQGEIMIYNPEGLLVKHLTKQQLLGTEGSFSWSGFDDQGNKVNIGVYIIVFQYFNLKGDVHMIKKSVTVAGKL